MAECSTLSINFNNESEYYLALLLKNFNDVKPFFFQDTGNSFHALIHLFLMFLIFLELLLNYVKNRTSLALRFLWNMRFALEVLTYET